MSNEIRFVPVDGSDKLNTNNGVLKVIRKGKLITFEGGQQTSEEKLTNGLVVEGTFEKAVTDSKYPKKKEYMIRASDSTLVIVHSSAALDKQMGMVQPGELIQINYSGCSNITLEDGTPGRRYNFKVLRALADEADAG